MNGRKREAEKASHQGCKLRTAEAHISMCVRVRPAGSVSRSDDNMNEPESDWLVPPARSRGSPGNDLLLPLLPILHHIVFPLPLRDLISMRVNHGEGRGVASATQMRSHQAEGSLTQRKGAR